MKTKNVWDEAQNENGGLLSWEESGVGTVLEAILLERKMVPSKFNPGTLVPYCRTQTAKGGTNFFATDSLDDNLKRAMGRIVKIEFKELVKKPGKNDFKSFDVVSLPNTREIRAKLGFPDDFNEGQVEGSSSPEETEI